MSTRILLASLLSLALVGQPAPPPDGPRGPVPMGPRARAAENAAFLAHHLKLSEAQRTQVKELHQRHRESIQGKQKSAGEAREALRKAAQDPATSADHLRRLHQAAADRQFEVMLERRAVRLESRALLTPEQRAEADRLQALGESRRQFRMERMRRAFQNRPGLGRGPMGPGRGPGGFGEQD